MYFAIWVFYNMASDCLTSVLTAGPESGFKILVEFKHEISLLKGKLDQFGEVVMNNNAVIVLEYI